MSAFYEAVDAVRDLALSAQNQYTVITLGALPASDGMSIAVSAGAEENTALDLSGDLNLDIVLNAKNKDQVAAMNALADVHRTITRIKELPSGAGWQLLSISTSSAPTYIDRDGDQFLYGSGLEVHIYIE